MAEQRKSDRLDTLNILYYQIIGADERYTAYGMGRTLNASESGLLLEVHDPLEPGQALQLTLGLEEDLVELRARVVRVDPAGEGVHHAGIQFVELDDRGRRVLTRYLEAFRGHAG